MLLQAVGCGSAANQGKATMQPRLACRTAPILSGRAARKVTEALVELGQIRYADCVCDVRNRYL